MRSVIAILSVAAVLVLGACMQHKGTGPAFKSFVNDPRGVCYAERQELERQGARFNSSFETTARSSDGVLAVAERYLAVLMSGERNLVEAIDHFGRDLQRENAWIGWTSEAFDTLTACRRAHALAVNNSLRAGRIGQAAAKKQIGQIRDLYREDTARFRRFADQIALNTATFAEVYTEFALTSGAEPVEILPPPVARPERAAASRRNAPRRTRLARVSLQESALPTARPQLAALRTELLTNTRKRDEVYQRIEKARALEETFDLAGSVVAKVQIA